MKKKEVKQNYGLIFLDRDKLEYFAPEQTDVYVMPFTVNLVKDIEVIDKNALIAKIVTFINQHKIIPAQTAIILSEGICFEKEIPDAAYANNESAFQEFLDFIPFDDVNFKIYRSQSGYKAVATNQQFYNAIKEAFSKMGFAIYAVVPTTTIGINIKNLDLATGRFLFEKFDLIRQNSLMKHEAPLHNTQTQEVKVMGLPRVLLLLGVFTVLMSLMLILLYRQSAENSQLKKKIKTNSVQMK